MTDLEIRSFGQFELRAAADNAMPTLHGYAAKFNSESRDLGGFTEVIQPGAFARSLKESPDVRLLAHHDHKQVLARVASGTLKIGEDAIGLHVEAQLPDTSYGRDLAVSMKRGDLSQMSFGFRPVKDAWKNVGNKLIRTLHEVNLSEASVVGEPAYPTTSASVRALIEEYRGKRDLKLNARGIAAAKAAVAAGHIDYGPWEFEGADKDMLLGKDDWQRYAMAFLAIDEGAAENTQERYAFPWGKMKEDKLVLFKRAVISDVGRAKQYGYTSLGEAADVILKLIDQKAQFNQKLAEM